MLDMHITLHLGYPKTATTTLQDSVFPKFSGISYHGKSADPEVETSLWQALRTSWDSFSIGNDCKDSINDWVHQVMESDTKNILISDEEFMIWRSPPNINSSRWVAENNPTVDIARSGSHPVNKFLRLIINRLPGEIELRGILTLRNRSDFLGSFAAELGFPSSNYLDVALRTSDASLEYFGIVQDLQKTLGDQNLLLLFYEDGLTWNLQRISDFIGLDEQNQSLAETNLNVKRINDGTWITGPKYPRIVTAISRQLNSTSYGRLMIHAVWKIVPWIERLIPTVRRKVVVSERQKQLVKAHFKNDTKKLSEQIGRNLEDLGY